MNSTTELVNRSTTRMAAGPSERTEEWMKAYMETLINPFSVVLKFPKLLDGEIKNTAAIKLRSTGEIVCSDTLATNIILFPGLTNVLCYCTVPDGSDQTLTPNVNLIETEGTIFKRHLSTPADRMNVRLARLTGAGVRFFLTNSAEEDEGYWEACRLTNHSDVSFVTDGANNTAAVIAKALATDFDLANTPTYQFGQLRDMHKWVFKLNSEDNDHKFSAVQGLNAGTDTGNNNVTALTDINQWDMIFIKVRGRRSGAKSVLRFDSVSNQELVYVEDSPLSRMMDETARDPNIEGYLEYSRVELPAFPAQA